MLYIQNNQTIIEFLLVVHDFPQVNTDADPIEDKSWAQALAAFMDGFQQEWMSA